MAAIDCSKISAGLATDVCGAPAIAGTAGRVILVNYSDVDKALSTFKAETAGCKSRVLTSIVLKAGAVGFEFASLPNTTVGEDTIIVGTYRRRHQHNLTLRIFAKSQAAKCFVDSLGDARVVAIVENNERGPAGEVKYEVYGWDAGLELNELTASTEITDEVVYLLTLGSGTVAQESSLPISFYSETEAGTDTAVEALLSPGVE